MSDLVRRAQGTVHVFTYKEGALSAVAHDLRFRVDRFDITLGADIVNAEFDLDSLTLDGPVRSGVVHAGDYDASTRAQVERVARNEVLHTDRHPRARFHGRAVARGNGFAVNGDLDLAGRKGPLSFEVDRPNGTYVARFEIRPSLWGIAPYKALLGAIRLKDLVRIELAFTEG